MVKKSAHFRIGLRSSVLAKKRPLKTAVEKKELLPIHIHKPVTVIHMRFVTLVVSFQHRFRSILFSHESWNDCSFLWHSLAAVYLQKYASFGVVIFGSCLRPSTIFVITPSNLVRFSTLYLPTIQTECAIGGKWCAMSSKIVFDLRSFCTAGTCVMLFYPHFKWFKARGFHSKSHSMQFKCGYCCRKFTLERMALNHICIYFWVEFSHSSASLHSTMKPKHIHTLSADASKQTAFPQFTHHHCLYQNNHFLSRCIYIDIDATECG